MLKKNQELELTIEDMGVNGEGIGHVDGMALFVKDALIGDRILARVTRVKKHYAFARMMEILDPSESRTEPFCDKARPCGGCQIQELSYEKQLEFKQKKVRSNLQRIGGFADPPMDEIRGMEKPYRYRNKAQFPVGTDKNGQLITGFYAGRTHHIVANTDCALGCRVNKRILELILDFMKAHHLSAYDEKTGKGLVRHVLIREGFSSGEIMVCLIINGNKVPFVSELAQALFEIPGMASFTLNVNKKKTNVILGEELITVRGRDYILDQIGDITYRISPKAFYQVNPVQTKKLYGLALEYAGLTGRETVWDLYCGIGTISLFLAQQARQVYGVEIVPEAIEDARENARINGMDNARFYVGKTEEVLPAFYQKKQQAGEDAHADVIVVDPPRKGCDESLLRTILAMTPDRIVYVSCDSATLARDLRILVDGGYELKRVCPVDMFPHTVAVESVALLVRTK